jgi:hypothetical protein
MFCPKTMLLRKSDTFNYILQLLVIHSGYFKYKNFSEGFWDSEILSKDKVVKIL